MFRRGHWDYTNIGAKRVARTKLLSHIRMLDRMMNNWRYSRCLLASPKTPWQFVIKEEEEEGYPLYHASLRRVSACTWRNIDRGIPWAEPFVYSETSKWRFIKNHSFIAEMTNMEKKWYHKWYNGKNKVDDTAATLASATVP